MTSCDYPTDDVCNRDLFDDVNGEGVSDTISYCYWFLSRLTNSVVFCSYKHKRGTYLVKCILPLVYEIPMYLFFCLLVSFSFASLGEVFR